MSIVPQFTGGFCSRNFKSVCLEKHHEAVYQWFYHHFYVPTGLISSGASAITAEAESLAVTGGNETGPPSTSIPLTGAVQNIC